MASRKLLFTQIYDLGTLRRRGQTGQLRGTCACLYVLLHATAKANLIAISEGGQGTASALYKVDPLTGAAGKIGDTGLNNIKGIAIHPLTGQRFAHRNNPGTDGGDLYTLDLVPHSPPRSVSLTLVPLIYLHPT
jgi:hypothetical protein